MYLNWNFLIIIKILQNFTKFDTNKRIFSIILRLDLNRTSQCSRLILEERIDNLDRRRVE